MVGVAIMMNRSMHPRPVTHVRHIRYANTLSAFPRHGQVPTLAVADTIHTPDPPNLPKIQCFRRWYPWLLRCRRSKNCMYLFAPSIHLPSLARIPFHAFGSYVPSWAHPCSRKLYAAHLLRHVSWSYQPTVYIGNLFIYLVQVFRHQTVSAYRLHDLEVQVAVLRKAHL